ncbi:MAG: HupE/UreJ family protein [Deltaproteobacteria bacterium]|nr:HupE/UreJ family protein [Deltaproteobacteria bacterium]MBW2419676.1 HupE/UreJ family protein [Deltaproteobacteria bacterium]
MEAVIGFSVALIAAENGWLLSGRDPRIVAASLLGLLLLCALAFAGHGVLSVATLLGLSLFSLCHFQLLARTLRPTRVRTSLAFAFGLVHGFGFAGVLAEMSLPTSRLAPALFGFNLGVEVGQLAVVALAWPLLQLARRLSEGRWYRLTSQIASAAICGLGLYWFILRTFAEG